VGPVKLGDKQKLFTRLLPALLNKAHELGFEVTLGDAFRDPRLFGLVGEARGYGAQSSCHKMRLAIDLNLFRGNDYLTTTADHQQLGEFWERQHELCRWGGRFNDANHYSLTHAGSK
jgi:hypothetical protein